MKLLIVGVDPGSTSAVAAVDLQGDIQLLESGKNFPPRDIIRRIIKVGKPVVVASDKGKTPSKVEKIANSVGARLFEPDKDLSSERKKELGKGANSHELDAVASAVHARKKLHSEINKVEKYSSEKDMEKSSIAEKILKGESLSSGKDAGEEVGQEESREEASRERTDNNRDREKERLRRRVENLEEHLDQVKSEKESQEEKVKKLEEQIKELKEEDREEVLEKREINKREAIIRDKNEEISKLQDKVENFKVREKAYRKSFELIFEEGYRPVPVVEDVNGDLPSEAVTEDHEVLEKLEKQGVEIYHLEEVDGVKLNRFVVADELPDKKDFESVIKEYRKKR